MKLDKIKNKCNFRPAKCCATCYWFSLFKAQYICRKNNNMPIALYLLCDKYQYYELADKTLRDIHNCKLQ